MRALRIVGRGLKDTYEHLFGFVLASLGWWVSALLIVTLPAGTATLFMVTDPRRAIDPPDWRETLGFLRANLGKAWLLALITLPVPVVLFANLYTYGGTNSSLAFLTPLWVLLFLIGCVVGVIAFAALGLMSGDLKPTLKRAGYVAAAAPFRTLAVFLLLFVIALACSLAVVPVVLLVPAIIGATVNRLVLDTFEIPVIDPSQPTDERIEERRSGVVEPKRRFWGG